MTAAPVASAIAGAASPPGPTCETVGIAETQRQDEQRHEPDPGRRRGGARDRAAEERDRGPGAQAQPGERRERDPAGDGRRLEQDRGVDPADERPPAAWTPPGRARWRRPWRPGTRRGSRSSRARTPPSRGPARPETAPIARMIAANAPNWARFFQSWAAASAMTGVGIGMVGSWSPAAASMISGRNFASSGELRPDEQEQAADDRDPQRPPRLQELLADEDRQAVHQEAAPTRRRNTSSSDGRARSNAGQPHARRDDDPEQLAGGDVRIGHRHGQAGPRPPRRDPPRASPRRRSASRPTASAWPGSGSSRYSGWA